MTIITRESKGLPLTFTELDGNFTQLQKTANDAETKADSANADPGDFRVLFENKLV